jgi:phage shock protein E
MHWVLATTVVVLMGLFLLMRMSLVSAEKARQLLAEGALLIDVRSPEEYAGGHLPGAINLPVGALRTELPHRVADRNQILLLHCLSGGRSGMAVQQLKRMGYVHVFNLGSYGRAENIVSDSK